ncbi:MAG TPA: sigma-70 family RNA polymerase sigma factor [Polyangiaceae bacterium]|nr:sigma-70 family RNA polymerase sigma factor [Polyangiaceae bacterium]
MSHRLPSSAALRVVPAPGQGQLLDFPKADAPAGLPVAAAPPESGADIPIEDLYRRFAPYVAAIASRILGRENEVEDVVQDVFMAALGGLKKRDQLLQAKSWFATVTVRSSMRKLRIRALWNVFDLAEPPQYERLADAAAGPEERRMIAEVYRALDDVSAKERVAWVLRHVQGESLEETALLCACSLATAKRRISAAHAAVKKRLEGGHGL